MAEKLRLILRSPHFISACEGLIVFAVLEGFLRAHAWQWGVVYIVCVLILYSRPIFNTSALLPLVFVIIALPFVAYIPLFTVRVAFVALFAVAFVITRGVKNLILTHRVWWIQCVSYALAYISFLLFFVRGPSAAFLGMWIFTLIILACLLSVTLGDAREVAPVVLIMGELLIVISWLPIGFLSSANIALLTILFIADALFDRRVGIRKTMLFAGLCAMIALTSSWRLP